MCISTCLSYNVSKLRKHSCWPSCIVLGVCLKADTAWKEKGNEEETTGWRICVVCVYVCLHALCHLSNENRPSITTWYMVHFFFSSILPGYYHSMMMCTNPWLYSFKTFPINVFSRQHNTTWIRICISVMFMSTTLSSFPPWFCLIKVVRLSQVHIYSTLHSLFFSAWMTFSLLILFLLFVSFPP